MKCSPDSTFYRVSAWLSVEIIVLYSGASEGFLPDIRLKRGITDDDLEDLGQGQPKMEEVDRTGDLDVSDVAIEMTGAFSDSDQSGDEEEKEEGRLMEQPDSAAVQRVGATSLNIRLSESASKPQHGIFFTYSLLKYRWKFQVFSFFYHKNVKLS